MSALAELAAKARQGVVDARLEFEEHLRPLVHGVLLAWVPHRTAALNVRKVISEGYTTLPATSDGEYVAALLARARALGQDLQRKDPVAFDPPVPDPGLREAFSVLARIRRLPERERERLAMRLVEGVPGPELADALGASEAEVTADLERALAALQQAMGAPAVQLKNDAYLWSLTGSPHPVLVRLENQLTPLRYDDSASPAEEKEVSTNPVGVPPIADLTPVSGPIPVVLPPEGKRGTSEHRGSGVKAPLQKPSEGVSTAFNPLPLFGDDDEEEEEMTEALRGDPRPNPFAVQPGTIAAPDLPAAAQVNPYAGMPGTLAASDLPAAARPSGQAAARAGGPVPGLSTGKRPTGVHASPAVVAETRPPEPVKRWDPTGGAKPAAPAPVFDPEATSVQPSPPPEPDFDPEATGVQKPGMLKDARPALGEGESSTRVQPVPAPSSWKSALFAEDDEEGSITLPAREQARLMRKKGVWKGPAPFALAIMSASIAIAVTWMTVNGTSRRAKRAWNLVPVTVAAIDLSEGTVVSLEMISTRGVPEQFVTASVVRPDSYSYVVGQKLQVPVQAGDPLLWSHFEMAQVTERLAKRVVKRARALTIAAGQTTSVGGWVRPGDWVDVIFSLRKTKETGGTLTAVTLVQDVPVVATGKITEKSNFGLLTTGQRMYMNVSVLLLPEEAEMVTLASEVGSFRLTLRNEEDHESKHDGTVSTARTLLDGARVRALHQRRQATIQNIRSLPTKLSEPAGPDKKRVEPRGAETAPSN